MARSHLRALDPDIEGNQSFVLNTNARWENTIPIAKKHLPEVFRSSLFREGSPQPTIPTRWDSSRACIRYCAGASLFGVVAGTEIR